MGQEQRATRRHFWLKALAIRPRLYRGSERPPPGEEMRRTGGESGAAAAQHSNYGQANFAIDGGGAQVAEERL